MKTLTYEEWQVQMLAAFLKLNAQLANEMEFEKLEEQNWEGLARKALEEVRVLA